MNKKIAVLLTCAVMLSVAGIARADEPAGKPEAGHEAAPPPAKDWSVTLGADYYSEYIFRGLDILNNDPLYVPSLIAKYKSFTFSYFGYYGDSDSAPSTWYEETDLSIDYTKTFFDGKLSVTAGALWYIYPDSVSGVDTQELYVKAAWSHYLNPAMSLYWDIDEFHGGYGTIGVSHSYDVSKALNLKEGMSLAIVPSAQLGIDFGLIARDTQSNVALNDILLGVNVPFYFTPSFCIHAGVQVSIGLDSVDSFYSAAGSGKDNEVIGNVGVSYSF